jgi:hypothetical protein
MKEFAIDGSDDEEDDDSEYEYQGGDMGLYDSILDEKDEITYLKGIL